MDEFEIKRVTEPDLTDPAFIEGLPGVGHVGKLAVEHLLEELDGELVRRVYSTHLPPQVGVEDGVAQLACAELHALDADGTDLLVLTGDHQAGDGVGHYGLAATFLDVAEAFGTEMVYTLGGVPTGELIQEYDVIGAVNMSDRRDPLEAAGVEFREDEPAGGIVGVSGLLLGLGGRRDVPAACLMGETSGYLVDPKSAQAVIETLQELLDFEVDFASLESRAEEMEEVVRKIQEMEQGTPAPSDEDLRYIG
jgi:uncharacterized protein (TIGR00162 family)